MRVAVYDPNTICAGIKLIYPDSVYFTDLYTEPGYTTYNQEQFYNVYGFEYRTDTENMQTFDLIIAAIPCYDISLNDLQFYKENMAKKIRKSLENSKVPIVLFDYYDYPYDPTTLEYGWKLEYICVFKRYYANNVKYSENVFPFPFMVFGRPCPLFTVLTSSREEPEKTRKGLFWSGGIYKHVNNKLGYTRDRVSIYNSVKDILDEVPKIPFDEWFGILKSYDKALDIRGVGDPNQRTLEIFAARTLRIFETDNLVWPFENGDKWPLTNFSTRGELLELLSRVSKEDLANQNHIVDKYFTVEWLSNYVNRCQNNIK